MKEFFTNPWVIGILGSIVSGLFVTWITRLLTSKKDNKDYIQKISQANKEIIYTLRPTISEGDIPSREIIKSLISSNSIKYGIKISNMYSMIEICDVLIKEVMDSSFISSNTKLEYCQNLLNLKQKVLDENLSKFKKYYESIENNTQEILKYKQKLRTRSTSLLGIITTIMTAIITILSITSEKIINIFESKPIKENDIKILGILIIATVIIIILSDTVINSSSILKFLKFKESRKEDEDK